MSPKQSISSIIRSPVTLATTTGLVLAQVFHVAAAKALLMVVWGNIAGLFTGVSIFAFTVIPNIDLGPLSGLQGPIQTGAIVLAIAYGAKTLYQFSEKLDDQLDES